jgi:hypothetical protein
MHAPAVLVADYAQTVDFAGNAGVIGRGTVQTPPGGSPVTSYGLDVLLRPTGHLSITDRRTTFDLRDSVALTVPDLENDIGCSQCATAQLYDYADVSLGWRSRRVRLAVREEASGGLYNSGNLLQPLPPAPTTAGTTQPPTTPTPVQLVPTPSTITTGSTRSSASADFVLSRLSATGMTVAYVVSGGLDEASRALLPLQRTVRGDAFYEQTVTRRDHLSTLGYVQDTQFSRGPCLALLGASATATTATSGLAQCAPHDDLAALTESWRHALTPATSLTLAAGLTAARSSDAAVRLTSFWCNGGSECLFPSADVSLASQFGRRGSTTVVVDASLIPFVDVRTGVVSERGQLVASFAERITRTVGVRADCTGSQTLPPSDPLAASIVMAGVAADFRATRRVTLTLSQRGLWEEQTAFGEFVTWITMLNVTVTTPVLRL